MLTSGQLNRKVTIAAITHAPDAYGQPQPTWAAVLTNVWASIHSASGKQIYAASGFVSQLSHVITVRYTETPILPDMHVRYGTRSFIVQAVSNVDEANVQLQLLCLELR